MIYDLVYNKYIVLKYSFYLEVKFSLDKDLNYSIFTSNMVYSTATFCHWTQNQHVGTTALQIS